MGIDRLLDRSFGDDKSIVSLVVVADIVLENDLNANF